MKPRERSLGSGRTISLLVTLCIVSLVLILVSQSPQLQPAQDALRAVVAPVQKAINDGSSTVGGWIQTLQSMNQLRQENEKLRQDLESLTTENAKYQEYARDNADLRRQLNFEREFPNLDGIGAIVLGRDPNGLNQILIIDRGQAEGVQDDMAVTDSGGYFIGRIQKADTHQAQVLLITDLNSSISTYVDRTGADGVVNGGWPDHLLTVLHLPRDANVGRGDLIKTSGSGRVPRGLLLGQIYNVVSNDVQLEQQADAYPLSDLSAVTQVLVILGGQGLAPPTATAVPTVTPTATALPAGPPTATPRSH